MQNTIRRYRKEQNLTLFEVAKRIGLSSPSHVAHWESGRKAPGLRNLIKLSIVLNVQVSTLYFDLFKALREELNREFPASPPPSI